MTSIFISYRREDSSGYAGRLHDRFVQRWGRERLFMDVDNIDPGEDFLEVIERTLAQCDVLVVVVGPRWLSAEDATGRRRVDNPADFHRMEVEVSLKCGVRVIPVLVGGAQMPSEADLPQALRSFARRNAIEVSDKRFEFDSGKLIDAIERALKGREQREGPGPAAAPVPEVRAAESEPDPASAGRATRAPLSGPDLTETATATATATAPAPARRTRLLGVAIGTLAFLVAALAIWSSRDRAAGPALALRGQTSFPAKWPQAGVANELVRFIAASAPGRLKFELLPAGAVAPTFGLLDAVAKGMLDSAWVQPGSFIGKDVSFALVEGGPFGPNPAEYLRWRGDPAVKAAVDVLYRAHGVTGMACGVIGPYADFWSTRTIRYPADLKGLKVRAVGIRIDVLTAAGAAVNALPSGEVAPAMERGIIDAAHFLDPPTGAEVGLPEVAKFMYYPGTMTPAAGIDLIFNASKWDSLPSDLRTTLERGCERAGEAMLEQKSAALNRALDTIQKSSVRSERLPAPVTEALRAAWRKVATEKSTNATFRSLLESTRPYTGG